MLREDQVTALEAFKERLPAIDGASHDLQIEPGAVVHGCVGGIHMKDYDLPPRRDYTLEEKKNAFAMIQNKEDWKAPIRQIISLDFVPIAQAACEFYTATPLVVEAVFVQEGGPPKAIVRSIGYRNGPAGP